MIDGMLAFGMPGGWELVVIFVIFGGGLIGLLIGVVFMVLVIKLSKTRSENRRLQEEADRLKRVVETYESNASNEG